MSRAKTSIITKRIVDAVMTGGLRLKEKAGTTTPFNTEKSLSAKEANFYGHYPYEIEENYFNNSALSGDMASWLQKNGITR